MQTIYIDRANTNEQVIRAANGVMQRENSSNKESNNIQLFSDAYKTSRTEFDSQPYVEDNKVIHFTKFSTNELERPNQNGHQP